MASELLKDWTVISIARDPDWLRESGFFLKEKYGFSVDYDWPEAVWTEWRPQEGLRDGATRHIWMPQDIVVPIPSRFVGPKAHKVGQRFYKCPPVLAAEDSRSVFYCI